MGAVGEILKSVNGIERYYIAGILIFIVIFMVILYRTIRIPKTDLERFKNSILDKDELILNKEQTNQNS